MGVGGGAALANFIVIPSTSLSECVRLFFVCYGGGGDSHRLATHSNQASPTAGGPRHSLTSEIRLTPLSQEVHCARTKVAWE